MFKSKLIKCLYERGFINDCTDLEGLDELLQNEKITTYIGYDATATSLHVGHLVNIMMLRWFQKEGHRVIALLGGGTTKVGDPSQRSSQRPLLTDEVIETNLNQLKQIFSKYLTFSDQFPDALMVNNNDWLSKLNYLDFLRDIGRHFSINRMLTFDTVKSRIEKNEPLSFLEFNYMILQGYDFYKLNENFQCVLQMGGSDQWGNIINGMELTRRLTNNKVFGLTSPLLTNASGQKMGKSATGAIWLNSDKLSPYEFWQFWRNCDDADVQKFLLLFTEIPPDQCKKLTEKKGENLNQAKIHLANQITELCHGKIESEKAFATSKVIFGSSEGKENLPLIELSVKAFDGEINIIKILTHTKLVKSGKEARRLINEKAIKLEDEDIKDTSTKFDEEYFNDPKTISIGRKKHYKIKINNL
tara:strand:+ start:319 stop:1566 length:1248 start_codon:yes stop_codon:yes gene_type:complete